MTHTGAPAPWSTMNAEVVDGDRGGGDHDHAPVAVDEQEGQRAEEVEVHLDQAAAPGATNSAE